MISKKRSHSLFSAVALLVGTAVGAGVFGLPYAFAQAGVFVGIVYVLVIGCVLLFVNLAYGEIVSSIPGHHQYTAYVERYLGKRWKILAVCSMCLGFYGALSAYLVEVNKLLFALFGQSWIGLVYFSLLALALLVGIRAVGVLEKILMIVMLSLITIFTVYALPHINISNYTTASGANIFLPYGVVLFALAAASAIPEMKEVLGNNRSKLYLAIIIGSIIPLVIYLVFPIVTVGITGSNTTESAVLGLGKALGPQVLWLGSIFGCITMTTSFLVLGLALREMFQYDLHIKPTLAWFITLLPPLVILALNNLSFIEILGISGTFIGGIDGIIIMHMHRQLRNINHAKSSFILHGLAYLVFIGGIAYEIWIVAQRLS
ncbi:MAG: aromatic amino acid transport family protein [Patescibacteria group bacterium]